MHLNEKYGNSRYLAKIARIKYRKKKFIEL
jgi:hypothetical protein